VDGQINEILIDDYVPVNVSGSFVFSAPLNNEIWPILLEKAWAKVLGGYDRLNGNPQ
jgi:hypothetical protein